MRILILALATAGLAYAGYIYQTAATGDTKNGQQASSRHPDEQTGKQRLGYSDPYIPPTKGNGF